MVAFISIFLAMTLLGVTVYGLHRYQSTEIDVTLQRTMPLPPLEQNSNNSDLGITVSTDGDSQITVSSTSAPRSTWMSEVASNKSQGNFTAALALCEHEFPLWSAFNQACIILRTTIKPLAEGEPEKLNLLTKLYQTAAKAELLHEKSAHNAHLPLAQLKQLDLDELDGLSFNYDDIGYANLRLIKKSDVKLMLSVWGRPAQHSTPRSIHQAWWQASIKALETKKLPS